MENKEILTGRRLAIAEEFWQNFEIPEGFEIESANGFEYSSGSNIFSRTVFAYTEDEQKVTKKLIFEIEFLDKTTAISDATIGSKKIKIPNRFSSIPSFGSIRTKKELTDAVLASLGQVEELGKMLDMEMEDGNFHSEVYADIAESINSAIKSLENIKEKL